MNRRDFLKGLGIATSSLALLPEIVLNKSLEEPEEDIYGERVHQASDYLDYLRTENINKTSSILLTPSKILLQGKHDIGVCYNNLPILIELVQTELRIWDDRYGTAKRLRIFPQAKIVIAELPLLRGQFIYLFNFVKESNIKEKFIILEAITEKRKIGNITLYNPLGLDSDPILEHKLVIHKVRLLGGANKKGDVITFSVKSV